MIRLYHLWGLWSLDYSLDGISKTSSWNVFNELLNTARFFGGGGYFLQLEIDDGDELTADFLYDEVHPKQHTHKQAFAKPRGPAGKRGHKRLIKGTEEAVQDS